MNGRDQLRSLSEEKTDPTSLIILTLTGVLKISAITTTGLARSTNRAFESYMWRGSELEIASAAGCRYCLGGAHGMTPNYTGGLWLRG